MTTFLEFNPVRQPHCKVELHVHLDGALRLTTVWELAQEKGMDLHVKTLEQLYDACRVKNPSTLGGFLKTFDIFEPVVIGDRKAIERIAYEFCEDAANQGIIYFEARYSPHLLSSDAGCSKHPICGERVTPRMVVESVKKGLQDGERDFHVKARSILCCIRGHPEWSKEVLELCDEFRDQGVVGIDVAGDESEFPDDEDCIAIFKEAMTLNIHRTVHAGEAGPASSVAIAVDKMLAERIGHGYHIFEDPDIYMMCLTKNVHFEACPYSSLLTGSVPLSTAKHPIVRYAEDGANFSISRDDPTVIQKTIDQEYELLKNFGLSHVHFTRANFNAARSCFLPEDEKQLLIKELQAIYAVNA